MNRTHKFMLIYSKTINKQAGLHYKEKYKDDRSLF
jgi:hypothetical protein